MRKIACNVYTGAELAKIYPKAFERAYQEWRETSIAYGDPWFEENKDSIEGFAKAIGVSNLVFSYDEWNYSKAIEFDGKDEFRDTPLECLKGIDLLDYLRSCGVLGFGSGYHLDDVLLEPVRHWIDTFQGGNITHFRDLWELTSECIKKALDFCMRDLRYRLTESFFLEEIETNGWEFFEDGQLFRWGD